MPDLRPVLAAAALVLAAAAPAAADAIRNPIAVFSGLDKITGRITTFEVPVDEPRPFGALTVMPRVCNTRPPTEEPKTTSFVEIDETLVNGGVRRIFTGWMLAESPGLNAVEHPVYDVWLVGCHDPNAPLPEVEAPPQIDPNAPEIPTDTD